MSYQSNQELFQFYGIYGNIIGKLWEVICIFCLGVPTSIFMYRQGGHTWAHFFDA